MITAVSDVSGKQVTRNSSFFKKVPVPSITDINSNDDLMDNDTIHDAVDLEEDETVSENDSELDALDHDSENEVEDSDQSPRRNLHRQRRRPAHLRDDIANLLEV